MSVLFINNFKWYIINILGCDRRCLFHFKFSGIGFISITTRLDAIIKKSIVLVISFFTSDCRD